MVPRCLVVKAVRQGCPQWLRAASVNDAGDGFAVIDNWHHAELTRHFQPDKVLVVKTHQTVLFQVDELMTDQPGGHAENAQCAGAGALDIG